MSGDSAQKYTSLPPDGDTKFQLKFNDGKTIKATKHDFLLSGFLTDYSQSGMINAEDAVPEPLPVNDFSSKAFELIHKITGMIKTKDEKLYLQYLNQEKVRGDMKSEYAEVFKNIEPPTIIETANLSAYLSMDLPKRVLVWHIAEYIRNNTNTIDDITKFLGATPLDEATCRAHGLDETDNIWEVYPEQFKKIFGKDYVKQAS